MAMKPTRLFVNQPLSTGSEVQLDERSSHYLRNVLRLRAGAPVHAFNGEGGYFSARIAAAGRQAVSLELGGHVAEERESGLAITLVQGIARGQKMDYTIQKAVELGVSRIVPVLTEYSQVKLNAARADKRLSHWRGVVASACEQCGRNRLPRVEAPQLLADWLDSAPEGGRLMLQPGCDTGLDAVAPPGTAVSLLIGPEGGLGDEDRRLAVAGGYRGIALGPRVLRTETAAVAALAVCQALWGDLRRT
jgi:16S rRNA (uracil1498-N3)-methyltransferase